MRVYTALMASYTYIYPFSPFLVSRSRPWRLSHFLLDLESSESKPELQRTRHLEFFVSTNECNPTFPSESNVQKISSISQLTPYPICRTTRLGRCRRQGMKVLLIRCKNFNNQFFMLVLISYLFVFVWKYQNLFKMISFVQVSNFWQPRSRKAN